MASPVDSARVATNISTAATSHLINVGSPAAGTLLIVAIRFSGAPGTVTFTGYTQLMASTTDPSDDDTRLYYRQATGSEGVDDPLTTTGTAVKIAAICWKITGAADPAVQAPEVSLVYTSIGANLQSLAFTPAAPGGTKDYLFLACLGSDGEGVAATAGLPGYTNLQTANSGTGGAAATNCTMSGCSLQATASSQAVTNWTHPAVNSGGTSWRIAIYPPAVTGTAHTVPINDTLAFTDSLTSAKGKTVQIPDTLALADVFSRTRTSSRAFADTVALTDARAFARGKAVADPVTLADLLVAGRSQAVPLAADVLALADAVNIDWLANRDQNELLNLTDSFTRIHVALRSVADAVVLADLASPVRTAGGVAHTRPIADTLALADSFARVMAYGRTQADGLTLVDSTRDAQGIRLGDVVLLIDALARATAKVRTIADTLALTDSTTRTAGKTKALTDAIVLTDQLTRATTKARTLADTIALADARRIGQGQALADAVALADQLTRIAPRIRTFTDTVLLSDAVLTSKTGAGALNPADLVIIFDSFTRIAAYKRSVADAVALTDARSLGRGKRVTDQITLADLLARATGKTRTITDLIALTDHVITSKVTGGYVLNYATDIRWGAIQADRVLVGADEVWTP